MASSSTRGEIVLRALGLAGRSTELKTPANEWLNNMLRSWALGYKYPSLRKIGAPSTLSIGSTTASLPSDFGAGMEKFGLLFGTEKKPIEEKAIDEFITLGGFPSSTSSGRPTFYTIDKNAGQFVFNAYADTAYAFTPIYFSCPADIPTDGSGDTQKVWVDNDDLVVQGLIEKIYQFIGDDREQMQHHKVYGSPGDGHLGLLVEWQRQLNTLGGTSRVQLSPSKFKTVRF